MNNIFSIDTVYLLVHQVASVPHTNITFTNEQTNLPWFQYTYVFCPVYLANILQKIIALQFFNQ